MNLIQLAPFVLATGFYKLAGNDHFDLYKNIARRYISTSYQVISSINQRAKNFGPLTIGIMEFILIAKTLISVINFKATYNSPPHSMGSAFHEALKPRLSI